MDSSEYVLKALHKMAELNNVIQDTHGNVSQKYEHEPSRNYTNNIIGFHIKPSGMEYRQIVLEDVCNIRVSGYHSVYNERKPSVDSVHHGEIYKRCNWIKAICHTHSPYAVAFAGMNSPIRCYLTEHADYFGKTVRCAPYSDLNNWGKDVAEFLQEGEKAVLLGNHGVLTFGDNAIQAVKRAAALENIAMKNYLIETFKRAKPLDEEEVKKWHERYNNVYGQ